MKNMRRETLTAILQSAPGMKQEEDGFRAEEENRFALYLGEPGNAMVVNDIRGITLADDYLVIDAGAKGRLYLSYETVHALGERDAEGVRAGGASVGFG
jgi:hypothetical protein